MSERIPANITIRVDPASQAYWIALNIPPDCGVVITIVVVKRGVPPGDGERLADDYFSAAAFARCAAASSPRFWRCRVSAS